MNNLSQNITSSSYSLGDQKLIVVTCATETIIDYPKDRPSIIDAINFLSKLQDDWDGNGAKAISAETILNSRRYIENVWLDRRMPDKVSPHVEGGIIFAWQLSKNISLWITIISDEIIVGRSDSRELPKSYFFNILNKEIFEPIPHGKRNKK